MSHDCSRVCSWETWLVKWALNELISYFDLLSLLSPLPLSQMQFFSDPSQMWSGRTLGQDLGRVRSWETWLVKWVLNELINYLDLPSLLPLTLVGAIYLQSLSNLAGTYLWSRSHPSSHVGDMALKELINSFDLPNMLLLYRVRFFFDRGQTWQGRTLWQDLGGVPLWETWLVKRVLNELINYFDLLSPLPLPWVQFFSDRGQTW